MDIKDKLIEYLEANNLHYEDRGTKIIHACINPDHIEEHPSAYTKLDDELPYSHCSSCKFHLGTEALYRFLELGFDEDMIFKSIIDKMLKENSLAESDKISVYLPLKDGDFRKPYRGISPETFEKVGAYYTFSDAFYGKRIIFPIRDYQEELICFEAISTNKNITPKVLRPKGIDTTKTFGFENLINSDTVFLCEGLFTALSFHEVGYDGLFNFGVANIKHKIRTLLIKGVKNVILVGDYDERGRGFNVESFHLLKKTFNVAYFSFPYGSSEKDDANDLLKQDRDRFIQSINYTLEKNLITVRRNNG